jgi:hypothetical protein
MTENLDPIRGSSPGAFRSGAARTVRLLLAGLFLVLPLLGSGCGYKVSGSVKNLPEGFESIGVPPFRNLTQTYRIEQRVSAAVWKELAARTRMRVRPEAHGADAVLTGEIRNLSSSPVTFAADTFGSAFLVTVQMSVKLVRTSDAKVIWENGDYLFRERYVLNSKVSDFFSEESPALDRLAKDFAASLVSTLLNRRKP